MNPQETKPFAVCFSGHRPEKLPNGSLLHVLQSLLFQEILNALHDGARTFYCGMAQGTDLFAADMVLLLQHEHPEIRLIAVRPFPSHGAKLTGDDRYHYHAVLRAADSIVTVCPQYQKDAFRKRNAYMVSHSDRLIALMTVPHSGTAMTVRMAQEKGLEIRQISPACLAQHKPLRRY
jgi:uncharacterized phage-like protein YoqJ